MKKLHFLWLLALLTGMFTLTACEEDVDEPKKDDPTGTTKLSVTPSSLSFSAAGGKKSLTVKSSYEMFGVDSSADWLDFDYDEVRDIVYVTAEANPTDKVRQANVTIMGTNDGEKILERVTVKVEQEAGEGNKNETNATATISPSGGKVEVGDLQLQFPSGTYIGEGEVHAEVVDKGSVASGDEVSDCYHLNYYADTRKPITVQIPAEQGYDVRLAVKHKGWIYSSSDSKEVDMVSMLPTTYANGKYTAEIPPFYLTESVNRMDVASDVDKSSIAIDPKADMTIALVEVGDGNGTRMPETRATDRVRYEVLWSPRRKKNYEKDALIKEEIMPDIQNRFQDIAFALPSGDYLPIYMMDAPGEGWGYFHTSGLCSEFDYIVINTLMFPEVLTDKLMTELKATLIHECLHYIQSHSYPGFFSNIGKRFGDGYGNVQWLILDEAASVWSEKFYTDTPEHTIVFGPKAIENFFPDDAFCSYHYFKTTTNTGEVVQGEAHSRCELQGYGLSIFMRYISENGGDDRIVKMFEARRDKAKNVRECFENVININYELIYDFMIEVCRGRLFDKDRINFDSISVKQGNDLGMRFSGKTNAKEVLKMPGVGAEVHKYYIHPDYKEDLTNSKLIITQASPDIKTSVWRVEGTDWRNAQEIGATINGEPFEYNGNLKDLKSTETDPKKRNNSKYTLYLITIPYFLEDGTSDLNVELIKPELKISPKELTFKAEGGTQEVTVTHNQAKLSYSISDKTWIKWGSVEGQPDKRTVTVEPNNSTTERTGTIILGAKDAAGNVMIRDTITIKQEIYHVGMFDSFYGSYWYSKKDQDDGKSPVLTLGGDGSFYRGQTLEGRYTVKSFVSTGYSKGHGVLIEPSGKEVEFSCDYYYAEMPGGFFQYLIYDGTKLVRWNQVDM